MQVFLTRAVLRVTKHVVRRHGALQNLLDRVRTAQESDAEPALKASPPTRVCDPRIAAVRTTVPERAQAWGLAQTARRYLVVGMLQAGPAGLPGSVLDEDGAVGSGGHSGEILVRHSSKKALPVLPVEQRRSNSGPKALENVARSAKGRLGSDAACSLCRVPKAKGAASASEGSSCFMPVADP